MGIKVKAYARAHGQAKDYVNPPGIEGYKWRWMMQYCKEQQIPPAQSWAWEKAKEAFHVEHHSPDQEL